MSGFLLALVLFTLSPVGASAATQWSAPENVSSGVSVIVPLARSGGVLKFDAVGRALASWSWAALQPDPLIPSGRYVPGGWRTATRSAAAAAFDPERAAPTTLLSAPVLYATSRAVALDQLPLGAPKTCGSLGSRRRVALRARFGRSTGLLGAPQVISTLVEPANGTAKSAANAGGKVLVAWTEPTTDCRREMVRASLRRPDGHGFGSTFTLRGTGRPGAVAAAVGQGGDVLVAWVRGGLGGGRAVVEARYRPAGGSWGPIDDLGAAVYPETVLSAAVAPNGRAYVTWQTAVRSEAETSLTVSAAVRPAGTARFHGAQVLERVTARTPNDGRADPVLTLAGAGAGALFAWTGWEGTIWRVRVAGTDSRGRFGPPQSVSAAGRNSGLGALAALPNGRASLVWSDLDFEGVPYNVLAAGRPPSGQFGAPEQVSDSAVDVPAVAINPVTGQPTAVWAQRIPQTQSPAQPTSFLRVSTRQGPAD